MSLPYLPTPHIIPAFQMLTQGVDGPVLMKLVDYVRKTWINSTVYQITSWCVFGQPVRTNNDVEGWHRRLNKKTSDQTPPFYDLVTLLHAEAALPSRNEVHNFMNVHERYMKIRELLMVSS